MGISQALANYARVVGDCDFRVRDIGVPELFPFEAVEALVSNRTQRFDLALNGDVASTRQHVLAILAAANGIFQMGMSNPRA